MWLSELVAGACRRAAACPGAACRGRGRSRGSRCPVRHSATSAAKRVKSWLKLPAGGADRPFVGVDREAAGPGVDRPRPGVADDRPPVAVGEPRVPDRRAVLLDRAGGQRRVVAVDPAAHVAQVVVDPVVDLVLHPGRGRLGEPGVLVGVVAELEDVVVLVGERHLEVVPGRGAGELEGAVVVVEDQVAVRGAAAAGRTSRPGRGRARRSRTAGRRSRRGRCRSCRGCRRGRRRSSARASRACRSRPGGRVRRPRSTRCDVVGDAVVRWRR